MDIDERVRILQGRAGTLLELAREIEAGLFAISLWQVGPDDVPQLVQLRVALSEAGDVISAMVGSIGDIPSEPLEPIAADEDASWEDPALPEQDRTAGTTIVGGIGEGEEEGV